MRVLLVTGSYPPMLCGVGDYAERLASALSRDADVKVSVLTSEFDAPATRADGVEVIRAMRAWHRKALEHFHAAMRRLKPDVVHIQFPTQGYDAASGVAAIAFLSRFRWRVPVVATLHEFLPRITDNADRWIHALPLIANRIVVVRPEYYATVPWQLRLFIPERKIRFITIASAVPRVELSESERQAVKQGLGCGAAKLVAFFGFSYRHKGVDLLFRIADPTKHHLLLIGHLSPEDAYHAQLRNLADSDPWRGRVTITGFVDAAEAGRLLAAADAAVFPFRVGGGIWNSSLHAAASQDTFALTTSRERNGYDAEANIYYARPEAVDEMRKALLDYGETRRHRHGQAADPWLEIAALHKELYTSLLRRKAFP
jgi:glycosyltransferase involved in cell wall biosynthesis